MYLWENTELSFQESGTVTICDISQLLVHSYFQGSQSSTWEDLINALFIWVTDLWSLTIRYSTAHFLSNIYIYRNNTTMRGGVLPLTSNPQKQSPKLIILKILNNNLLLTPFIARIPLFKYNNSQKLSDNL